MTRSIRPIRPARAFAITGALAAAFAVAAPASFSEEAPAHETEKELSGMSILGNDESPKSLVIVPWKSSDLGGDLDLSRRFGQDRQALDPEVFRRRLDYHAIRTGRDDR